MNAIGHRLWRDLGSVVIKQYPDSINIINSGGFPNGVTKDNILTVNPTWQENRDNYPIIRDKTSRGFTYGGLRIFFSYLDLNV
jgi:ATP-dependent DNA helicase RecG